MIPSQNIVTTCAVLHPILDLLDGPRGENRTFIHELLRDYHGESPIVGAVTDLTERVTHGEIKWPEYTERCRVLIAGHQCGGDDATSEMS